MTERITTSTAVQFLMVISSSSVGADPQICPDPHPPRWEDIPQRRYFISSIGFAIVAFVCAAAGLTLGLNRGLYLQDTRALNYISAYAILVFPYLFSRCSLIEGGPDNKRRSSDGLFVPLIVFALLVPITLFYTVAQSTPHEVWYQETALLALGLVPFIYLWIRMVFNIRKEDLRKSEYRFKSKVLLPALAVCLVSFSYGWLLRRPHASFALMILPIVLIGVGGQFITARHWSWALGFILATIACTLGFSLGGVEFAKVLLIGIILALAMGVSETCKRAVWLRQGHAIFGTVVSRDDGNGKEDSDFYLAGANWSSAVFPLLLCIIPLLVPKIGVFPIFLILTTQYVHWHFFAPFKRSVWLIIFNVALGYTLPLVLFVQFYAPFPNLLPKMSLEAALALVGIMLTGFITVVSFTWIPVVRDYLRQLLTLKGSNYHDERYCYLLFVTTALPLIVPISVVAAGANTSELRDKAHETIIYLAFLITGLGIAHAWRLRRSGSDVRAVSEPKESRGPDPANLVVA